jgi:hypothetical protein
MSSNYFKSVNEQQDALRILGLSLPTYRQAYSDRTAWVMAVMSEVVYVKFNPLFEVGPSNDKEKQFKSEYIKKYLIDAFEKMEKNDGFGLLNMLRDKLSHDPAKAREILDAQLGELDFKVIETFDREGSQAMLVEHKDYLVLAFRGTETDSLTDIKADASANIIKCETQGMIHRGFLQAYNLIRKDIEMAIDKPELNEKPLYITGHSLGGALATVATKFTYHKGGLAACYTFGSPRVGNDDWINNIKTPIHRLVNAADCVTMLPPGDVLVTLSTLFFKFVPGPGYRIATWLKNKFGGYIHAGNMRYLTNCEPGDFDDVKVLYTVSFLYRMKALIYKSLPWSSLLSDHSISVYSKKLMIIAFKRNRSKMDENEAPPQLSSTSKTETLANKSAPGSDVKPVSKPKATAKAATPAKKATAAKSTKAKPTTGS